MRTTNWDCDENAADLLLHSDIYRCTVFILSIIVVSIMSVGDL